MSDDKLELSDILTGTQLAIRILGTENRGEADFMRLFSEDAGYEHSIPRTLLPYAKQINDTALLAIASLAPVPIFNTTLHAYEGKLFITARDDNMRATYGVIPNVSYLQTPQISDGDISGGETRV